MQTGKKSEFWFTFVLLTRTSGLSALSVGDLGKVDAQFRRAMDPFPLAVTAAPLANCTGFSSGRLAEGSTSPGVSNTSDAIVTSVDPWIDTCGSATKLRSPFS